LFGSGTAAVTQLGLEVFGIVVVMVVVFLLSYITCAILAGFMGGITRKNYSKG
jgi:ammonia channel protein AmtB